MSYEVWQHRDVTLYRGDCLEVLPTLAPGSVDAVVTDPPYGISYEAHRYEYAKFSGVIRGDEIEFDPAPVIALGLPTILWGGNNYADRLPTGGWICWDKRCCEEADKILGSPFELAWASKRTLFKIVRLQHGGAVSADRETRVHPTQKPVQLMRKCVEWSGGNTIIDPYMGSGTTGVACIRTGRKFIGIEIDPGYFEVAKNRVLRAYDAEALFTGDRT